MSAQPIKTAPRDGTPIILFTPEGEVPVAAGIFDRKAWGGSGGWVLHPEEWSDYSPWNPVERCAQPEFWAEMPRLKVVAEVKGRE